MVSATSTLHPWPRRMTRSLAVALGVSVLLHLAWSLWPVDGGDAVEPPLRVTLQAMPAPPVPVAQPAPPAQPHATPRPKARVAPAHKPRPRPPTPVLAADAPAQDAVPADVAPEGTDANAPPASAPAAAPPAPEAAATAPVAIGPPAAPPGPQLPPRLDLAYKVFLGTQGFLIGDATYRFEHDGNDYRISTVAQARGLAALLVHGRGVIESRGVITPAGLKPAMFAIERGDASKREEARFDWKAGTITLRDQSTQPLGALTFDPLTVLWQTYFTPPDGDVYRFSVATTRKVYHYTVTREGEERMAWRGGEVDTVRWHRVNDDNKTEAWFWLAPSLHFIPVKIRVTATSRGTLEAVLDAIRSDATPEAAGAEPPLEAQTVTRTDPFAAHGQ